MREEGVEVALGAEVEDLRIVRVVEVREDTEKLAINVLGGRWEVGLKFFTWRSEDEGT